MTTLILENTFLRFYEPFIIIYMICDVFIGIYICLLQKSITAGLM